MTQKQKELLLKDLCARLPYGVKVHFTGWNSEYLQQKEIVDILYSIDSDGYCNTDEYDSLLELGNIKPYLFPLSSMTKEQYNEIQTISGKDCMEHMEIEKEWRNNSPFTHLPLYQHRVIEFFHKYHFDYRGLIPMGLAIDAIGKNIY